MRTFLIIILFLITNKSIAQLPDIETKTANRLVAELDLSMSQAAAKLQTVREFYKNNPPLTTHYDFDRNDFIYDSLMYVPGLTRERLFERCKEFVAINYGRLDAVLHYEDIDNGRIVFKGLVRANASREFTFWEVLGFSYSSADFVKYISIIIRVYIGDQKVRVVIQSGNFMGTPLISYYPLVMNPTLAEIRGAYALVKNTDAVLSDHLNDWADFILTTKEEDQSWDK